MERKNTVLLTVIAVATLLVAVVGATFAYFTAQNSVNAVSTVEVQTSQISSVTSTATNCTMKVEGTDMLQANGREDGSAKKTETCAITITGTHPANSSSNEVCTYDLTYTPSPALETKSAAAITGNKKEATIAGSAATDNATYSSLGGSTSIAETDLYNVTTKQTLVNGATFTYGGPAPASASSDTTSTATWTFTLTFYNYNFDQNEMANKTFGGTLAVENFSCVASAVQGS